MATMAKRNAQGSGTIRQRANGTWEGRFTLGKNAGTGKQVQKSIYGKTQKEVRRKLTEITSNIDKGLYVEPSKLTVGAWLDTWLNEFIKMGNTQSGSLAEGTIFDYTRHIEHYIKPAIGAIRLTDLKPYHIQKVYNELINRKPKPLSAKTIKNLHSVIHSSLEAAKEQDLILVNPSDKVKLPKINKTEINPLNEQQQRLLLEAVKGTELEAIYKAALFTGMRQGELMGLTWDRIDFEKGTIKIDRQMITERVKGGKHKFSSTKTQKSNRVIMPAPSFMKMLKALRVEQKQNKLKAGKMWDEGDFVGAGLVFTNSYGHNLYKSTITNSGSKLGKKIGLPDFRFHDLRHTYAVNAIKAGDDIKTISSNLGHTTISITLDLYAHFTDDMRKASSERMESYLQGIINL
ncbi:MAG: site-specific integrase [Clostridia bacterium]|nr:site-specific integrase [Clostridia bacterium]